MRLRRSLLLLLLLLLLRTRWRIQRRRRQGVWSRARPLRRRCGGGRLCVGKKLGMQPGQKGVHPVPRQVPQDARALMRARIGRTRRLAVGGGRELVAVRSCAWHTVLEYKMCNARQQAYLEHTRGRHDEQHVFEQLRHGFRQRFRVSDVDELVEIVKHLGTW